MPPPLKIFRYATAYDIPESIKILPGPNSFLTHHIIMQERPVHNSADIEHSKLG